MLNKKVYTMLRDRLLGRLMEKRATLDFGTISKMSVEQLMRALEAMQRRLDISSDQVTGLEEKIEALESAPESPVQPKGPRLDRARIDLANLKEKHEGLEDTMEELKVVYESKSGQNWSGDNITAPAPTAGHWNKPLGPAELPLPKGRVKEKQPHKPQIFGPRPTGPVVNREEIFPPSKPGTPPEAQAESIDAKGILIKMYISLLSKFRSSGSGTNYNDMVGKMLTYLNSRLSDSEAGDLDFLPVGGSLRLKHMKGEDSNKFIAGKLDAVARGMLQSMDVFDVMLKSANQLKKQDVSLMPEFLGDPSAHSPVPKIDVEKEKGKIQKSRISTKDVEEEVTVKVDRINAQLEKVFSHVWGIIEDNIIKNLSEDKSVGMGRKPGGTTQEMVEDVEKEMASRPRAKSIEELYGLPGQQKKGPFAKERFEPEFGASLGLPGRSVKENIEDVLKGPRPEDVSLTARRPKKDKEEEKKPIKYEPGKTERVNRVIPAPRKPRLSALDMDLFSKIAIRRKKRKQVADPGTRIEHVGPVTPPYLPHRDLPASSTSQEVMQHLQKDKERLKETDKPTSVTLSPASPEELERLMFLWQANRDKAKEMAESGASPESLKEQWKIERRLGQTYNSLKDTIEIQHEKLIKGILDARELLKKLKRAKQDPTIIEKVETIKIQLEQSLWRIQNLMKMAAESVSAQRRLQDTWEFAGDKIPVTKRSPGTEGKDEG